MGKKKDIEKEVRVIREYIKGSRRGLYKREGKLGKDL